MTPLLLYARRHMSYEIAVSGGIIIPALFIAALGIFLLRIANREKTDKKAALFNICTGIYLIVSSVPVIILALCDLGKYAVSVFAITFALPILAIGIFGIICIFSGNAKKVNLGFGSVIFLLIAATVILLFGILTVIT